MPAGGLATATLIGAGASLIPSIFQGIKGIFQKRQANKINPIDPGYQMNNAAIDASRIYGDRYGNYQLPGYNNYVNQIGSNMASSFNRGSQGASSSGDILDLATKIAYGGNQATNNLALQNAQGKENALNQYMQSNILAGKEYQDKNAYDREQYMNKLKEKAALAQAGDTNLYGALNTAGSVGTGLAMSTLLGKPKTMGDITGNPQLNQLPSITTPMLNKGVSDLSLQNAINPISLAGSGMNPNDYKQYLRSLLYGQGIYT